MVVKALDGFKGNLQRGLAFLMVLTLLNEESARGDVLLGWSCVVFRRTSNRGIHLLDVFWMVKSATGEDWFSGWFWMPLRGLSNRGFASWMVLDGFEENQPEEAWPLG